MQAPVVPMSKTIAQHLKSIAKPIILYEKQITKIGFIESDVSSVQEYPYFRAFLIP
jgi:hypothetical protein